jgi:hypothetical protein
MVQHVERRAGIFKPLWRPGIDAKASIPPAYVAWRDGTITLFLLGASPPKKIYRLKEDQAFSLSLELGQH